MKDLSNSAGLFGRDIEASPQARAGKPDLRPPPVPREPRPLGPRGRDTGNLGCGARTLPERDRQGRRTQRTCEGFGGNGGPTPPAPPRRGPSRVTRGDREPWRYRAGPEGTVGVKTRPGSGLVDGRRARSGWRASAWDLHGIQEEGRAVVGPSTV